MMPMTYKEAKEGGKMSYKNSIHRKSYKVNPRLIGIKESAISLSVLRYRSIEFERMWNFYEMNTEATSPKLQTLVSLHLRCYNYSFFEDVDD